MNKKSLNVGLYFSLLIPLCLAVSCSKKNKGAAVSPVAASPAAASPSPVSTSPSGNDLAGCGDGLSSDFAKPGSVVIPYHISSTMIDSNGNYTCTTKAIKEKIKKVFDLYASIPESGYSFHYAGQVNEAIDKCYQNTHNDGSIHVFLNQGIVCGVNVDHAEFEGAALWGPAGAPGNFTGSDYPDYPGAHAIMGIGSLDFPILIHEIGHTLTLNHSPAIGSHMSYDGEALTGLGSPREEYLSFTEQDRADLVAAYPAPGAKVYSISGTVPSAGIQAYCSDAGTQRRHGAASAFAVDTSNGHLYAGIVLCGGAFRINLLQAGNYRVFVNVLTGINSKIVDQTQWSPSWYINSTTSTNDPVGGTILTVSNGTPNISGLTVTMLQQVTPFTFEQAQPVMSEWTDSISNFPLKESITFLAPGETADFILTVKCRSAFGTYPAIAHCSPITSVAPYGTSPDYSISFVSIRDVSVGTSTESHDYKVTVTASPTAKEGHRLLIARAASGNVQAGPIGIHILRSSKKPNYLFMDLVQFLAGFDLSGFDPTYWY